MGHSVPLAIFGVLSLIDGILIFYLLPETTGKQLPDTFQDAEDNDGYVQSEKSQNRKM